MPNRLASQTSPYLRQHAGDPVDWHVWGDEAFELARSSDRPIFLSIGYASCHWCHVMHRESFSDPSIAEKLNASFVPIKVDRESRPDVDEHYMGYVVAATGHGGWPMSVFLTPGLVPVFGGTYYPPEPRYGVPSFPQVLDQLSSAFSNRRDDVALAAEESLDYLRAMFAPLSRQRVTPEVIGDAARGLVADADPRHGGFGQGPKFPQAPVTDFLIAYSASTADPSALDVACDAVRGMLRGGIHDHAGGGIARYSVDGAWLVPHFEKMLYDNAQLLSTLAALHRLAPDEEWVEAIRGTVRFLERDLRTDSGAYASSLDADTEGVEGATYVWTYEELTSLLDSAELSLAADRLGVSPTGNWEGVNILTRREGRGPDASAVDALLATLLEERLRRDQPALDEKVIVSWNALTALGLLDAGDALSDDALTEKGRALVDLLLEEAVEQDGGVVRLLGDAQSGRTRVLEDASALTVAALRASELFPDGGYAERAADIFERAGELFYDGDGTWYSTPADTELPARPREQHDSPMPSGASLAAFAAAKLARAHHVRHQDVATRTLERLVPLVEQSPSAAGFALQAMLEHVSAG